MYLENLSRHRGGLGVSDNKSRYTQGRVPSVDNLDKLSTQGRVGCI